MTAATRPAAARPRARSLDLRSLLAALPAIVAVPLMIVAAVLLYLLASWAQHTAEQDLRHDVRTLAAGIDRELQGALQLLHVGAEIPALQDESLDLARFEAFARRVAGGPHGFQSIALIDPEGRFLVDTLHPQGGQWIGFVRPHHEAVFRTGRDMVSDLFTRVQDGQPAVSLTVPVRREGRIEWVLAGTMAPSRFLALLPERAKEPGVIVTLYDRGGHIVARSRDPGRWIGRRADPRAVAAFAAAPHGVARFASFEGEDTVWSWQTLPQGWVVLIGMPASTYHGALSTSLARLGAAGGAALLGGLLLAGYVGRRIHRSVSTMRDNASRLLEGDWPPYRPSGIRQLDELYGVLEAAGARVSSASAERERAFQAERAARAEAEAANRAKDEFLAMLSHELRNPLPPIVNMVRFLVRGEPLTAAGRRAVDMIGRQVAHVARLIDDLMEANRVTKGKIRLHPARVPVAALVSDAVEAAQASAGERAPRIVVSGLETAGEVHVDPVRMKQVLGNLLDNAIKFSRHTDHPIQVEVRGDADGVQLSITDRGAGIDPASLPHVFELFTQADATFDRAQGGLGIGLALVRALVRMHGGKVSAHSAGRGQGATFTLRLPRRPPPEAPASAAAEASISGEIARPATPQRRIADQADRA